MLQWWYWLLKFNCSRFLDPIIKCYTKEKERYFLVYLATARNVTNWRNKLFADVVPVLHCACSFVLTFVHFFPQDLVLRRQFSGDPIVWRGITEVRSPPFNFFPSVYVTWYFSVKLCSTLLSLLNCCRYTCNMMRPQIKVR